MSCFPNEFPICRMIPAKIRGSLLEKLIRGSPKSFAALLIEARVSLSYLKQRVHVEERKAGVEEEKLNHNINQIAQQAFNKGWICLT